MSFASAKASSPPSLVEQLMELICTPTQSTEAPLANPTPRCRELISSASTKTAALTGAATIIPGPLGLLTLGPEIYFIMRIERQLVADIAACQGRTGELTPETMMYSLFVHKATQVIGKVVIREGGKLVVKRATTKALQELLMKIGIKLAERTIGKVLGRCVPILGAVGCAVVSGCQTDAVGERALETFSSPIEFR